MARRNSNLSSHHRHRINPSYDATLLAADRVLAKESEYQGRIRKIQSAALQLAEKISIHGSVTKALLDSADTSTKVVVDDKSEIGEKEIKQTNEETLQFLTEQREKLKDICAGNVKRVQNVSFFLDALGSIRDDIRTKQQLETNGAGSNIQEEENDDDEGEESDQNPPDYRVIIEEKITKIREQREQSEVGEASVYDHQFSRQVRERLGEKEKKKRAKNRSSRGGYNNDEDEDDDDELEIIPTNADHSENALKCPITGMLFENPLRNKICGHVYSRAGFEHLLKTRKLSCPVHGCTNQSMTWDQLEEDYEMEMRVDRYKKRLQREQEAQSQYTDDEDDVGEEEAPRMTFIH